MGRWAAIAAWTSLVSATGLPAYAALALESPPSVPAKPPPAAQDTVTQSLGQDSSSRLTLSVEINGKGPYAFLVDTGSDRSSISRELAASLALPPGPTVVI